MSQRELNITVAAGGSLPVRAAGDFIFCKMAVRPVVVRLNGQAITMRAGDKQRIQRNAGDQDKPAFTEFDLDNTAGVLPLAVQLVVGVGDYNSQIVTGELIVAPGIQTADGRYLTDSRRDVRINLSMLRWDTSSETAGDIVYEPTSNPPGYATTRRPVARVNGTEVWQMLSSGDNDVIVTDAKTGDFLRAFTPVTPTLTPMPNVSATGMAWDGRRRVYAACVSTPTSTGRIFAIDTATGIYTEFASAANTSFYDLAIANGLLYVMVRDNPTGTSSYRIMCYRLRDGALLHVTETGLPTVNSWTGLVYGARSRQLFAGANATAVQAFNLGADGAPIPAGEAVAATSSFSYPSELYDNENLIYIGQQTYGWRARRWNSRTYYGEGYAATELATALIDPEEWRRLLFAVDRVQYGNNVGMAGPVIRAAIELTTGGAAPADYLDYVYAISYFDPAAGRERMTSAGGRSFLAANIADDFITLVPGSLTLSVRDGIL